MKIYKLMFLLFFGITYSVDAQLASTAQPSVLEAYEIFVTNGGPNQALYAYNIYQTSGEHLIWHSEREGYEVRQLEIVDQRTIVVLEVLPEGMANVLTIGRSEISEIDLLTGERNLLLSSQNVIKFWLSPNRQYAVLTHFPFEGVSFDRHASPGNCLVTFRTQQCVELDGVGPYNLYSSEAGFIWASESLVTYVTNTAQGNGQIHLVNTSNGSNILVDLPADYQRVSSLVPLYNSGQLLVTSVTSCDILVLDVNALSVEVFLPGVCGNASDVSLDETTLLLNMSGRSLGVISLTQPAIVEYINTPFNEASSEPMNLPPPIWRDVQFIESPVPGIIVAEMALRTESIVRFTFAYTPGNTSNNLIGLETSFGRMLNQ